MYYYEIEFNDFDRISNDFGTYNDDNGQRCAQTFCIANRYPILSVQEMIDILSEKYATDCSPEEDLINSISYQTAQEYENITGLSAPTE